MIQDAYSIHKLRTTYVVYIHIHVALYVLLWYTFFLQSTNHSTVQTRNITKNSDGTYILHKNSEEAIPVLTKSCSQMYAYLNVNCARTEPPTAMHVYSS